MAQRQPWEDKKHSDKEDAIEVLNQSLVREYQQSLVGQKEQLEEEHASGLST